MSKLKDFLFNGYMLLGSFIFFLYIAYLFLSGNLSNQFLNNNVIQFIFSLEIQFINNIYSQFNDENFFIGLMLSVIFIVINLAGLIFLGFFFIIFLGISTLWIGFIFPKFYHNKILGPLDDFLN